jgi:hypothetical protein
MALTQVSSGLISSVANTAITGNIISSQITSVANTQITGNIISSQITSVANTQVTGLMTASQIATVANTQITGNIISSQITSVANTQVTGLITSGQIATVANTQITGVFTASQGGTGNANLTFPTTTSSIGYLNIPQNSQSAAYTTVAADAGYCIFHPASDANARTFTIAANASVPYALGTVIQFINMSANNVTIAINSDTLTWSTGGTSGSRTLAQWGVANCVKIATTQWLITGSNLT